MADIRKATSGDAPAIWTIAEPVIRAGETYALDRALSREGALEYWLSPDNHASVAELAGRVVGTFILKRNHQGGGAHIANAAFMVAEDARGRGTGRAMAEHCLAEARRLGFRALQFNFVISTNKSAIRLWEELGMKIVGTLPDAFRHPTEGYVDAYVMFRSLV